jgi:Kef-type K+ transport system membrane component KefB
MQAGIVVGPTFLGRAMDLHSMGVKDPGGVMNGATKHLRVLFMFFIGVELDVRYLRRHLRRSLAVACGGFALCLVFAVLGGRYFYELMNPGEYPFPPDDLRDSTTLFALVLTSTASPVLIRIVTELKLTGSEIGQLAIGAAFANDMASVAALSFVMVRSMTFAVEGALPSLAFKAVFVAAVLLSVLAVISVAAWAARLLNRLRRGRQYIHTSEMCALLLVVSCLAEVERVVGYSNSMTGFLIGLAMPREGPTARTIVDRLAYPMHSLVMPLCFAAIGGRLDFARVQKFKGWVLVHAGGFATVLSLAGTVAGTVLAGRAMGVAPGDAVVLGFLLNVKGYSDVLAINFADKIGVWNETAQAVLLLSSILNTFMAGPASAAIVRKQRRPLATYQSRCLQDLKPADHELSVLACVHGAAGVHSMLALAELSGGRAVHLLHLVELVNSSKYTITHHLFHHDRDDDDWGSAHEIDQVAAAVAAFTLNPVQQMRAISSLASMDADVCNAAEDARALLVLVPSVRELRYDGRLVCRREGRRALNQRVLQRAPCTVGVLVERRHLLGDDAPRRVQKVVALFLGGPDDREAVAYAARVAAHPLASVTVCRFLPAAARGRPVVVVEDEEFMADLHSRLVVTGLVSYTERHVGDGAEMVTALRSVAGTYSLVVLGRSCSGAGAEAMTRDLGDSDEEVPELGPVGELLASDDFKGGASVLVLQQHSMHKTRKQGQEQPPQQSTPTCPC